jgi:hypothetical protein
MDSRHESMLYRTPHPTSLTSGRGVSPHREDPRRARPLVPRSCCGCLRSSLSSSEALRASARVLGYSALLLRTHHPWLGWQAAFVRNVLNRVPTFSVVVVAYPSSLELDICLPTSVGCICLLSLLGLRASPLPHALGSLVLGSSSSPRVAPCSGLHSLRSFSPELIRGWTPSSPPGVRSLCVASR